MRRHILAAAALSALLAGCGGAAVTDVAPSGPPGAVPAAGAPAILVYKAPT